MKSGRNSVPFLAVGVVCFAVGRRVLGSIWFPVVAERGRLRERVGDGEEMAVGGIIGHVGRVVALVGELRERVEGGLIGVAARGVAGQGFEGDVAQAVARVAGGAGQRIDDLRDAGPL